MQRICKKDFYDQTIKSYCENKLVREYSKRLFPERRSEVRNVIEKFTSLLQPYSTIIDIGSGTGKDVNYFRSNGFNALGIDISPAMIKFAKNQYGPFFSQYDVRNISSIKKSFEGIFSLALFQHIYKDDLRLVFEEINKILEPSGVFCIITKEGKGIVFDERLGKDFLRPTTLYSINDFCRIFNDHSYRLLFEDHFGLFREGKEDKWLAIILKKYHKNPF